MSRECIWCKGTGRELIYQYPKNQPKQPITEIRPCSMCNGSGENKR